MSARSQPMTVRRMTVRRRPRSHGLDRGSVSVLVVVVMVLVLLVSLAVARVGAVAVARVRAQAAADLAALAALTGTAHPPAELAARIAAGNGARLVTCACHATEAVVTVARDVRLGPRGPVVRVTAAARATAPVEPLYPHGLPVTADAAAGRGDPRVLLDNPRLELSPAARADLEAGIVDPRLVALLDRLLRRHRLAVSVFRTGHARYVAGTRVVSKHSHGRAADIWKVDGERVRPGHRPSREVTQWLSRLPPGSRPSEVGSPFPEFEPLPGHFSNADHLDHLHVAVG